MQHAHGSHSTLMESRQGTHMPDYDPIAILNPHMARLPWHVDHTVPTSARPVAEPTVPTLPKRGEWKRNHARRYSTPLDVTSNTPLGNRYAFGVYGRDGGIQKYRRWLFQRIQERHVGVMAQLKRITPASTLMCTCRENERCHADVIIRAWSWLVSTGVIPKTWTDAHKPAPTSTLSTNYANSSLILRRGETPEAEPEVPPVPVRYTQEPEAEPVAPPKKARAKRPASKPRRTRAQKELAWITAALKKATVAPDKAQWSFVHASI
jgi:hypothetical protein